MKTNSTLIAALLDHSGSMIPAVSATEEGWNGFIEQQKTVPGDCQVTLSQFDTEYEVVYPPTDIKDVPEFRLLPRGGTALLDGMGKLITDTGVYLSEMAEDDRPEHVIVVVMTDGEENSSREWSVENVKQLIEQQESQYSWTFLFLGANIDAVAVGGSFGFKAGNSINFNYKAPGVYTSSMANVVTTTRSGLANTGFTDDDRDDAMGTSQS